MNHCGLTKGYRVRKLKSHVDNRDPNVSLKGLDMSFKLDGSYAPEKHLNVNLDLKAVTAEMEALQGMIDEYEKQHPEAAKECENAKRKLTAVWRFVPREGNHNYVIDLQNSPLGVSGRR
jgi:hypothetical protein